MQLLKCLGDLPPKKIFSHLIQTNHVYCWSKVKVWCDPFTDLYFLRRRSAGENAVEVANADIILWKNTPFEGNKSMDLYLLNNGLDPAHPTHNSFFFFSEKKMDSDLIFQLTTSTIASVCCGSSLAFWLLSIRAPSPRRLSREPFISSQVVIGSAIFLGLLVSILLAFLKAKPISSKSFRSITLIPSLIWYRSFLADATAGNRQCASFAHFKWGKSGEKRERGNTNFCQYLSISTLQPCLTHVVSALFFLGTVAILPLSMYFSVRSN